MTENQKKPVLNLKPSLKNENILKQFRQENPFSRDVLFQKEFAHFKEDNHENENTPHRDVINQLNDLITVNRATPKFEWYVWLAHELFPEDIFFMSRLASYLIKEKKDLELATRLLTQVSRKDPTEQVIFDLANVLVLRSQFDTALKWLNYISEHFEEYDTMKVTGLEAKCLIKAGRFQEALRKTNIKLKSEPKNPIAYLLQGEALLGLERFTEALNIASAHLTLEPTSLAARGIKAEALLRLGRLGEALQVAEERTKANPDDVYAQLFRAQIFITLERFPEALEAALESVHISPNSPAGYGLMTQAYLRVENFEKAVQAASEKIRLEPNNPTGYMLQAQAYIGLNQYDKALEVIQGLNREVIERSEVLLWLQAKCFGYAGDILHCKQNLVRLLHIRIKFNYAAAYLALLLRSTEYEPGEKALLDGLREHFGADTFLKVERNAQTFDWGVAIHDTSDEVYSMAVKNEFWSGLYDTAVDTDAFRAFLPERT